MAKLSFKPARFLTNAHVQTIWGRLARPRRLVALRREALTTPDGDELIVDHLDAPVTAERPLHFLLMHGLEGSSNSVYMQGLLSVIARHGHAATAINHRSCARDPRSVRRMLPNRRPRFYHSGETADFDFVANTLARRGDHFVAIGASLGGNMLLKWLGEHPGQQLIRAAATLSVPYDLAAGARFLETTALGRFYVSRFLATLKQKVSRPDIAPLLDMPRVRASRTFWEFDDVATAPLHGFRDAADYYARSSSLQFLGHIDTPTLCVSAVDDPFVPPEVLTRVQAAVSPSIDLRMTSCGGHVGFISGSMPWRCEYWAEELVVHWLIDHSS
jgi:predicted alpha/beta-fold hydrolase